MSFVLARLHKWKKTISIRITNPKPTSHIERRSRFLSSFSSLFSFYSFSTWLKFTGSVSEFQSVIWLGLFVFRGSGWCLLPIRHKYLQSLNLTISLHHKTALICFSLIHTYCLSLKKNGMFNSTFITLPQLFISPPISSLVLLISAWKNKGQDIWRRKSEKGKRKAGETQSFQTCYAQNSIKGEVLTLSQLWT